MELELASITDAPVRVTELDEAGVLALSPLILRDALRTSGSPTSRMGWALHLGKSGDPMNSIQRLLDALVVGWADRDQTSPHRRFVQAALEHRHGPDLGRSPELRARCLSQVRRAMSAEPVEDGMTHPAERVIHQAARMLDDEGVIEIVDGAVHPAEAADALRLVARCELPRASAARRRLVESALTSEYVERRDAAVQAMETWEDRALLDLLQDHQESVAWLAQYIEQVIQDLGQ
ncbi:MAG: hypothetical protein R6V85_06160 [Polyangia bacterium]